MYKQAILKIIEKLLELEKEYFKVSTNPIESKKNPLESYIITGKRDGIGEALQTIKQYIFFDNEIKEQIDNNRL